MKIWFQNRRTKWKKQENVTSEQTEEDDKRTVDEDDTKSVCDKKVTIDSSHNSYKTESDDETKEIFLTVKNTKSFFSDKSLQVT